MGGAGGNIGSDDDDDDLAGRGRSVGSWKRSPGAVAWKAGGGSAREGIEDDDGEEYGG